MATQKNREQLPRVVTRLKRPPSQNSDSAIIPKLQNEQVLMGGGGGQERRGANYCSTITTAAAAAAGDGVLT